MRAERLGSYSIEATVAGMPDLSRLKSMMRSLRLCPPPRCQMVMSPELRRPPVRSLARQRLVRIRGRHIVVDQRRAVAQRRRSRSVSLDCHNTLSSSPFSS